VADGDAAAVHAGADRRREVLKDSAVGSGGTLSLAVVVLGLASAGFALARLPPGAAVLVVIVEVGAKLGMAMLVCRLTAAHEGLGSALSSAAGPRSLLPAVVVAAPAGLVSWLVVDPRRSARLWDRARPPAGLVSWLVVDPDGAGLAGTAASDFPSLAALVAAVAVALLVGRWARTTLGGVSGDVLGAANELGRVAALHARVIAWTRF
jgi:adenosylcobinamide-GDP ribazoletransferase